jgi:transposase
MEASPMEVTYPACAGLDVHKKTVVACALLSGPAPEPRRETRSFGTMTADLLALADWLVGLGVTHVAMESTGELWKPVYNLLEGTCTVLVVNAAQIKHVPGRKTDVGDAQWIADLLRHGLLRPSFIPPLPQRDLRDLTRQRASLVQERAMVVNQLQKVLEWANLKLAGVATDVTGVSARAMLQAIVAGETDPTALADLARKRLRAKRAQLEQALAGRVRDHHRFMLAHHLTHLEFLEEQLTAFDARIADHLATALGPPPDAPPTETGPAALRRPEDPPLDGPQAVALLDTIPGIGRQVAEVVVAEVGTAMERFGSPRRLARWAKLCPGTNESAGKRHSGRTGAGNRALRSALVQAAHAAVRVGDCYPARVYRRLVGRRGAKRAIIAVAHRLLHAIYYVLLYRSPYVDYQPPAESRQSQVDALRRRLEREGYNVTLEPIAATG